MSTTTTGSTGPTAADLNAVGAAATGAADAGATQTLSNLAMVHSARLSQLTRNAAVLKKQYGAGNATVLAAEAAARAAKNRVARLTAVRQQTSTPAPQVASTGWALQGRVFNSTLQPVEHLTVFLVDATNTYQQEYGFAYTDNTGYFLINYTGGDSSGSTPIAGKPTSKETTASSNSPQLYIEIANASGKPIYLGTDAFSPALGSITYQNITLPAGEKPLGNPPSTVRGTTIPTTDEKQS